MAASARSASACRVSTPAWSGRAQTSPGKLTPAFAEKAAALFSERLAATGAAGQAGEDAGPQFAALETVVRNHLSSVEEAGRSHERDLAEIYEALVKLGTNQQTLANNLNTWRLDTSGDVSIVSNRLEVLEQTMLESLGRISAEAQMLRHDLIDDEAPRRGEGFKRWLYGTGSVLTNGWPRPRPDAPTTKK